MFYMQLSPRPEPTVRFSEALILRDSYIAVCSGVYALSNSPPGSVIINFMEGKELPTTTSLPSLNEGWRAIGVTLSVADARALAEELLRRADENGKG